MRPDSRKPGRRTLLRLGLLLLLLVPPVRAIVRHHSPGGGFLDLICFGREFAESALPEVRAISPVASSPQGYDGQFYAQLALHPALVDPALARALDNPTYRARRIGLPFLAFCLGLGRPAWILQIFALLNLGFWLLLLVILGRFVGWRRPRDFLLAFALLWSTGTLVSVVRSLTDFPAAVLGVLAVLARPGWIAAAVLLGAAGLIKEASVLSLAAVPWRGNRPGVDLKRLLATAPIVLLPIALWILYVHFHLPSGPAGGSDNFALPFAGIAQKLSGGFRDLVAGRARAFEILCPLSLLVQAAYLASRPRIGSAAWRFGIGFAALLCFLGRSVWVEQYAYSRALLPLTFSFNLLLHEHESGARFRTWYLAGNGGMLGLALRALTGG